MQRNKERGEGIREREGNLRVQWTFQFRFIYLARIEKNNRRKSSWVEGDEEMYTRARGAQISLLRSKSLNEKQCRGGIVAREKFFRLCHGVAHLERYSIISLPATIHLERAPSWAHSAKERSR